MPSLPKPVLANHIIAALGSDLLSHGSTDDVPFTIEVSGIKPKLAVFAYTISDPPGGRSPEELKIQLIAPGQQKGEKGNFEPPDEDSYMILLGYSPDYDVFALFDAYKHRDFAFSKNCQLRLGELTQARITGIGYRDRHVKLGTEHIVMARSDHLAKALGERIRTP